MRALDNAHVVCEANEGRISYKFLEACYDAVPTSATVVTKRVAIGIVFVQPGGAGDDRNSGVCTSR